MNNKNRKIRHGIEDMNKIDGIFKVKLGYEGKIRRFSVCGGGRGGIDCHQSKERKGNVGLNLTLR